MTLDSIVESREERDQFTRALLSLDRVAAWDVAERGGAAADPLGFVERVVVPTMEEVGSGWERGDLSLSQIYMSGRICEEIVDEVLPPAAETRKTRPTMAICVLDDYHMLGKRIVYTLLRSGGYRVLDYGRVTADEAFNRLREDGIETLFVSVLMLQSALAVGALTNMVGRSGEPTKIVVGGAPFRFDGELWHEVGADAMGSTASDALRIAEDIAGVPS